jgi:hypothetical protein
MLEAVRPLFRNWVMVVLMDVDLYNQDSIVIENSKLPRFRKHKCNSVLYGEQQPVYAAVTV